MEWLNLSVLGNKEIASIEENDKMENGLLEFGIASVGVCQS